MSQLATERLYDCPVCLDTGWEPSTKPGTTYERVSPCPCARGVCLAAGDWRDRLRPFAPGGKRIDSASGRAAFEQFRARHPLMANRILDYLAEHPEPVPRGRGEEE